MKRILYFPLLLFLFLGYAYGQDTLYHENFEGTGNTFTLNTTDLGGSSTPNFFVINNAYTGGSGSLVCLGFPFSYTVNNTPVQPAGVTNSPNSSYLHTMSVYGQADNIFCSSFAAADGTCILSSTTFTKMSNDVSTVGYDSVGFSFWWNCSGGTNIYGEVLYSTNSGTSWTTLTTPISQYKNQSSWTQQTIYNPAFDNQPTLRFAYRFVNNVSSSALDPGFSIDDVTLTGHPDGPSITTDPLGTVQYCAGDSITVCYTVGGGFFSTPGTNVFTAELSDASGSFGSPTILGTQMDTVSGCISAVIPPATPAGTGYRVRVVGSDTSSTSQGDNGADITVFEAPSSGSISASPDTLCGLGTVTLNSSGASGAGYIWEFSVDGINWDPVPGGTNPNASQNNVAQTTFYRMVSTSGSCDPDTSNLVKVTFENVPVANFTFSAPQPGLNATFFNSSLNSNTFSWDFGDGNSSSQVSPSHSYAGPGDYEVCLIASNACAMDDICDTVSLVCPVPTVYWTISANRLTANFTDSSTATGASVWAWDFGDGNTSNQINPSHTYLTDGTYYVCLTLTDSCGSNTYCDSVTVDREVGIEDDFAGFGVKLFPNPAKTSVKVHLENQAGGSLRISLHNALGQEVEFWSDENIAAGEFERELNIPGNIRPGIYFVQIRLKDGVAVRKLRIE